MRHDSPAIGGSSDHFGFGFDTFYDRRNALMFDFNALGGRVDAQITNERQVNFDWNPVWDVKVGRFEGGWTFEAAIPFKSLRYRPGRAQIWGFQAKRRNLWKNEASYLTRIPASAGIAGHLKSSLMATLVGLEVPSRSVNLDIKPYVISGLTSDPTARPRISNDVSGDFGVDAKYGVTQSLTADLTYKTDFAQVEADEQQVNLTRFSLFFPEKRDFFLENQGTFAFASGSRSFVSAASSALTDPNDTPLLFYSRRIGLERGRAVPIQAGGRLTGRAGRFSVGVLNIQAEAEQLAAAPATNFTVARVKRDILRKSSIGAIFTGRSIAQHAIGSNEAYGIDGTFAFYDDLAINTYWAQTRSSGRTGDDTSYRAQLDYTGDRYGVQLEHLMVGDDFNPEVGFVRRVDMRRNFGQLRFSPRPRRSKRVRKYFASGSFSYIENGAGRLETRQVDGEAAIEFHNTNRLFVGYSNIYEYVPLPFPIAPGITLPVQGYDYSSARGGFTLGPQRKSLAATVMIEHGTFYSGHKTSVSLTRGRTNVTSQLTLEPRVSFDTVELAEGSFVSRLVGSRVTYTMTPLMFVSALVQYNSSSNLVAANVRFRWEYQPGSELFVVWNEQRDTFARGFPELANRALIIKVNRLFRI
jgi:hypothetical protein